MGVFRISLILALAFIISDKYCFGQTTTVSTGSWSTPGVWSSGSVPGNGTNTVVNHALTLNRNLSPSGNYTFNAPVIDATGSPYYSLTVNAGSLITSPGSVDINANTSVEGGLVLEGTTLGNGGQLTIRSGDTLFIGYPGNTATACDVGVNASLTIESGGVLIVYGNMKIGSNSNVICDGEILIDGNFYGETGYLIFEFPSEVSGSGSITTTGTITTDGNSTVFGSKDNCSSGPCSGGSTPCGVTNTISSNQSVCSGTTPATITGNNPTGSETYQWEQSTTSPFTGFSNISGATGLNLAFSSGISTTTWYRRKVIKTGPSCTSTSASVKITVNPALTAGISISTSSATTFCGNSNNVNFTATPTNGGTNPSYQWKRKRGATVSNVGTNSATYNHTANDWQDGDIIYCVMTSNYACISGSPATSNEITIHVLSGQGSWDGSNSSNWNTNANWCSGSRPTITTDVVIYGGAPNDPVISTNAAVCDDLTLNAAAILTVNGRDLTVDGNLTINSGGTLLINGNTVTVNGNITINSGGTLTINSPGALSAKGNITNNGTMDGTGTATLNGTVAQNISGTGSYKNITLNNTAGAVATSAVNVTGVLTLTSGALTSNGNLTIDLNTGCIAGTGSGSITGNIRVAKTAYSSKYHYISSPIMTGMTVNDWNDDVTISLGPQYTNLYYYNETIASPVDTDGWTAITSLATPLNPLEGYALYFNGSATIDQTGSYTHGAVPSNVVLTNTVSSDPNVDGWNLVGNPYPSTLDWDAASGWTKTGIDGSIYFWDPVNDRYASYVGGIGTNGGTRYIPSMQSFWVHVSTAGGTGTFGMNNNVRVSSTNPTLWKVAVNSGTLRLKVNNGSSSDETVIRFKDEASNSFDDNLDAYKLKNDGNTPSLYTKMDGYEYSINSISNPSNPDGDVTIPLHLKATTSGSYSISAINEEEFDSAYDIILQDLLTGDEHNLRDEDYTFTADPTDATGRFLVVFKSSSVSSVLPTNASGISVWSYESRVYIETINTANTGDIVICNMLGKPIKTIYSADLSSGSYTLDLPGENGMYIVKVKAGEEIVSKKIFLK